MKDIFTLEYADGYYIELNGVGILNFTEDKAQDFEFCNSICDMLNFTLKTQKDSNRVKVVLEAMKK